MTAAERMTARDYRAMLALSDARKADNASARARTQGNAEVRAQLEADAERRGETSIDWSGYFARLGL